MSNPEPIYYRLKPVFPTRPGDAYLASAAVVTCLATGEQLHHCGGPGPALSTDIVEALDMVRQGGKPAMIVNKQDWDDLRSCLDRLRRVVEERGGFDDAGGLLLEAAERLIERTAS